jgi:hypothetical protein
MQNTIITILKLTICNLQLYHPPRLKPHPNPLTLSPALQRNSSLAHLLPPAGLAYILLGVYFKHWYNNFKFSIYNFQTIFNFTISNGH